MLIHEMVQVLINVEVRTAVRHRTASALNTDRLADVSRPHSRECILWKV